MNNQPAASISESKGVRNLHLETSWVQGAMRLSRPDAIELEYVQQMMMWALFNPQPRHIVQLGLGAATLTRFCYKQFLEARVTAIELNGSVIEICKAMFGLPANDGRLNVIEMDALDFVMDTSNHGTLDILQVDLYDNDIHGPTLDSDEFYKACADCLTKDGIMTTNLFCDYPDYSKHMQAMSQVFEAVVWLPEVHDGNVVVIAFIKAPQVDFSALYERAAEIRRTLELPAESWVDGLQTWMQGG